MKRTEYWEATAPLLFLFSKITGLRYFLTAQSICVPHTFIFLRKNTRNTKTVSIIKTINNPLQR